MFVVATDFDVAPFSLPGLNKVGNTFSLFVTDQEEEKLRLLLGNLFFEAFKAGIEALPAAWVNNNAPGYAIDAVVYRSNHVWKSLQAANINHDPADPDESAWWQVVVNPLVDRWISLRSGSDYLYNGDQQQWVGMIKLVKPLIYSLWIADGANSVMQSGVSIPKLENSQLVSPADRICDAWNKYRLIACGRQVYHWSRSQCNSLYGYLNSVASDFDDLVEDTDDEDFASYLLRTFTSPQRMNSFGL